MRMELETLSALLLNYKQFPISRIEKAYFRDLELALKLFKEVDGLQGIVIVQTCNRVELYCDALGQNVIERVAELWGDLTGNEWIRDNAVRIDGEEVVRHLFRLSSGLESMIIGEQEILHQVKDAYFKAVANKSISPLLKNIFENAIRVGKKVRAETAIGGKRLSMAHVAADAAEKFIGDLNDKTILIVGAGETGTLVNAALKEKPYRKLTVLLANRTYEKAVQLANLSGGIALHLSEMERYFEVADVIFVTTNAPHYLIRRERIAGAVEKRCQPLLIIDLSVPRNVDPGVASLPNVKLIGVDDLKSYVDDVLKDKLIEVGKVDELVENALREFMKRLKSRWINDLISEVYKYAERVRREEVEEALSMLGAMSENEKLRRILDDMSRAVMKRVLHPLIYNLKKNCECFDKETILRVLKTPEVIEEKS